MYCFLALFKLQNIWIKKKLLHHISYSALLKKYKFFKKYCVHAKIYDLHKGTNFRSVRLSQQDSVGNYMFKVNNRNTSVSIVNFEHWRVMENMPTGEQKVDVDFFPFFCQNYV